MISITPLAAFIPYKAQATASFRTFISLRSDGLSVINASDDITLPSITYNGSLAVSPSRKEEFPRIRILGFEPRSPVLVTIKPGTVPCKAKDISIIGLLFNRSMSTRCTTPDFARISISLILGRATTTTSSNDWVSCCIAASCTFCPTYFTRTFFIPIKEKITISPSSHRPRNKYRPSASVTVPNWVFRTRMVTPGKGSP